MRHAIFLTGGTGFLGRQLIRTLVARGHAVKALVRPGSEHKTPQGAECVVGNPLDAGSFRSRIDSGTTFVHMVGVNKPAPWKGRQFRSIDLASLCQSVDAAANQGVRHFVFISVAQPAPLMKSYIQVRRECEQYIAQAGLAATILRPWYVLGPGRRWPLLLAPFYRIGELCGAESALRLGLLSQAEMTRALVWAVENPGTRILDVPAIRATRLADHPAHSAV
ncbi:MAG: NAD(P)H-binding protein [Bryobacteraceae bacterium]|nr:NAD(P)H-binding protein [Bryobacteraceae bacterium]